MSNCSTELSNYTVYYHKNKTNGKLYFGITSRNVKKRWQNGNAYKKCTHFERAIQKYGWDGFEHGILFSNVTKEEASALEIALIALFDTQNPEKGYNCLGGGSCGKWSDSMKERMSKARLNYWEQNKGIYDGEKNPNYGKHWSDESKQRMSELKKKQALDPDYKKKMSECHKGITPPNKGVPMSEEQKRKISLAKKGCKGHGQKKVRCIETGKVFDSVSEAAKSVGVDVGKISGACHGHRKTSGGFHWKYESED